MSKSIFAFGGVIFESGAIEAARLVEGVNGAEWHVPTKDGAAYATTGEGLRLMRHEQELAELADDHCEWQEEEGICEGFPEDC